jgi:hypothetical protein
MMNGGWVSHDRDPSAFLVGILWRLACFCARRYWCRLYSLGDVPQGQWMEPMNDMHILIEQMISDICDQAIRLDDLRLRMFLNWLGAHGSKIKTITKSDEQPDKRIEFQSDGRMDECLKNGLRNWFESLSMQGLLWEYHLILNEIAWWRDLDPRRLAMILKSETENLALSGANV